MFWFHFLSIGIFTTLVAVIISGYLFSITLPVSFRCIYSIIWWLSALTIPTLTPVTVAPTSKLSRTATIIDVICWLACITLLSVPEYVPFPFDGEILLGLFIE